MVFIRVPGAKCVVHMLVFLATVLSGLTYEPVSLLYRFMNVAVGGPGPSSVCMPRP